MIWAARRRALTGAVRFGPARPGALTAGILFGAVRPGALTVASRTRTVQG
jgi:hypothetical protein